MSKSKSSSISLSSKSTEMNPKKDDKWKKGDKNKSVNCKPTIDREIAKGLDTLDRQGLKYLKQSLKASRLEFGKQQKNYVEQQIQNNLIPQEELNSKPSEVLRKKDPVINEIQEEIIQTHEQQQQATESEAITSYKNAIKKVSYNEPGKIKMHVKPRPISAISKPLIIQKNQSMDVQTHLLLSPQNKFSGNVVNPFKTVPPKKQSFQVQVLHKNSQQQQQIQVNTLWKRIQKLEQNQRAQLELILEKMEKGEIQSVQLSDDVILIGKSVSKNSLRSLIPPTTDLNQIIQEKLQDHLDSSQKEQSLPQKKSETIGVLKKDSTVKSNLKPKINSTKIISNLPQQVTIPVIAKSNSKEKGLSKENSAEKKEKLPPKSSFQKTRNTKVQNDEIEQNIVVEEQNLEDKNKNVRPTTKNSPSTTNKIDRISTNVKIPKDSLVVKTQTMDKMLSGKQIKLEKKKQYTIILRVIKTWGHSSIVGLTEIQLFQRNGNKLTVYSQSIKGANKRMMKLFNNKYFTTEENDMWSTTLPDAPNTLQIQIYPPKIVGALRIWNFNKSLLESTKGVKQMEIVINSQVKWSGEIQKGSCNQFDDYSTLILLDLHANAKIQSPIPPQKNIPPIHKNETISNHEDPKTNPEWLEQTAIRAKLQQIQKEQLKAQNQNKQFMQSKRYLMNRTRNENFDESATKNNQNNIHINYSNINNNQQSKTQKEQPSTLQKIKITESPAKIEQVSNQSALKLINQSMLKNSNLRVRNPENIKYFDVTNEGRLKPGERQRFLKKQAEEVQRDVEQSLMKIRQNLNFQGNNNDIFSEMDILPKKLPLHIESKKQTEVKISENLELIKKQPPNKKKTITKSKSNLREDDDLFKMILQEQSVKKLPKQELLLPSQQTKIQNHIAIKKNPPNPPSQTIQKNKGQELDDLINQLNTMMPKKETPISIPNLPSGTKLKFAILSTWGDPNYVGLTGIQFFDDAGLPIFLNNDQITSNYSLTNSTQYKNDPRTVQNLINGVYLTTDQYNLWLAPFKKNNFIMVNLQKLKKISMIRIWNYNHSRIHTTRGVRNMRIEFDNTKIFQGEIQRSNGQLYGQSSLCQYILFTNDDSLIKKICDNDWLSRIKQKESQQEKSLRQTFSNLNRPITALKELEIVTKPNQNEQANNKKPNYQKKFIQEYETPIFPKGSTVKIFIHSTWGDRHYVGLNGIELYDDQSEKIIRSNIKFSIKAQPSSINALSGFQKDQRTIDKLVNGVNQTYNDKNMWLAPFVSDIDRIENHLINSITLKFEKTICLGAIQFFNYTKTPERGAHQIQIRLDEILIYRGYIRIAPSKQQTNKIFNTMIVFSRDPNYLKKISFENYNEDNKQQDVSLVNEQKVVKSISPSGFSNLERPSTSVSGTQSKF